MIDLYKRRPDKLGVEVGGDVGQRVAVCAPAAEGLGDRHRPVDELPLGRKQGQLHARAGQVAQREQRLEPGDPAAGDEHANESRRGHRAASLAVAAAVA